MGDQSGGEHRVETAVTQRQPRHIGEGEAREAVPALAHGGVQHRGREVHAEDGPLGADRGAQRGQRAPRPAPRVEDRVPGSRPEVGDGGGVGGAVVREAAVPVGRPGVKKSLTSAALFPREGSCGTGTPRDTLDTNGEAMR
ncbi:hypothetical protein GCM10017744_011730 [Streptomyces antimycoticus]